MNFELENEHPGIDKNTPPSEVARRLIKSVADPYIELEQQGYVKGLRVIVKGSLINRLKEPVDYDILILFDDYSPKTTGDKGEILSPKAKVSMNKLTAYDKDKYDQRSIMFSFRNAEFPYADLVDLESTSVENFLKHLYESDEDKKKDALQQLFRHPKIIYRQAVPDDRILDGDPGIDYETIDKIVLYSLIMAKGFNYKLSREDMYALSTYSYSFRFPEGANYEEMSSYTEEYLDQNISKVLSEEQITKLSEGLEGNKSKTLAVLGKLTSSFVDTTDVSKKFKDRVLWIFEMLKNNLNGEQLTVESGRLIYGDNIENQGKPLFIEDKEFLNLQ